MKVHFIGIGGIGMSGIAIILLNRGIQVSGSDAQQNSSTEQLRSMGAQIYFGHSSQHANGSDLVVYSSSISPNNPELVAARNGGIPVVHRGRLLAAEMTPFRTVAITGSHGKSTTTAMCAELLLAAGLDPTVILGAELESLKGNARQGNGRYGVIEADESDGSFLWLNPFVGLITNIDYEHLDYFRNMGEILEAYAAFADRIVPRGVLIGCMDQPFARRIIDSSSSRAIRYGLSAEAQITAEEIRCESGKSIYRCRSFGKSRGSIHLNIPGLQNVTNSLAVVALAHVLEIDFSVVQKTLENYRSLKRRFQIRGEVDDILVVEDYAHHPTEIEAVLRSARGYEGRRIRCVFQPHRYSRTRFLLDRFSSCFDLADELILLPIYAASEEPMEGFTSEILCEMIRSRAKKRVSLQSSESVLEQLTARAVAGDLILFLGAGNVGALAPKLVDRLKQSRIHYAT